MSHRAEASRQHGPSERRCSRHIVFWFFAAAFLAGMSGCRDPGAVFADNTEARHLTSELRAQFAKASQAAERAVLANTDEAAGASARDAEKAREQILPIVRALAALLHNLEYADEAKLLEEFRAKFTAYEVLDRQVLGLAVENTNVKASRLSFGAARESADAFNQALLGAMPEAGSVDARALALEAIAAVREMQALQAPHIAEAKDDVMTALEGEMARAEAAARRALDSLAGLGLNARLISARAALDRFSKVNVDVISLSRRNTNVRSLSTTLGQKRTLSSSCEESLETLANMLRARISRPSR